MYPKPERGDEVLDIIFLHGIGGDWEKTWCPRRLHRKASSWPILLGETLAKDGVYACVFTVDYPARKFGHSSKIEDQARYVLDMLKQESRRNPVFFICHSLGGLIVKQMLQLSETSESFGKEGDSPNSPNSLLTRTRGILFLGTPHRGARVAWWLRFFGFGSMTLKQLSTKHSDLIDLNEQFCRQFGAGQLTVAQMAETKKVGVGNIGIKIVSSESANSGVGEKLINVLERDHITLPKCRPGDQVFDKALQLAQRIISAGPGAAPAAPPSSSNPLTDGLKHLFGLLNPQDQQSFLADVQREYAHLEARL